MRRCPALWAPIGPALSASHPPPGNPSEVAVRGVLEREQSSGSVAESGRFPNGRHAADRALRNSDGGGLASKGVEGIGTDRAQDLVVVAAGEDGFDEARLGRKGGCR